MNEQTPAIAVETSNNAKLGAVSATYASQASCPTDCPWYGRGCYAEQGYAAHTTRRLNRSEAKNDATIARAEADAIGTLTGDRLLRLHVVGDSRTNRAARIVAAAARAYARKGNQPAKGKKVWTYTHAHRKVKRASWGDAVSVLASVETIKGAVDAMSRGYAAAIVVQKFEQEAAYDVNGVTLLPCPNQTKGVTCRDCGLCRDDDRLREQRIVIAFEAHGSRQNTVRKTLMSLPVTMK